MGWRMVAAALDVGTAVCAGVNSAYFCDRWLGRVDSAARRIAVFVLGVVSFGTMIEALALLASEAGPNEAAVSTSAEWAAVRVLPFAGAAGISTLIARGVLFR
jgi:hypothetical protein